MFLAEGYAFSYKVFSSRKSYITLKIPHIIINTVPQECNHWADMKHHQIAIKYELKVLRKYNILVLAYAFLIMLEAVGLYMDIKPLYTASCVCIGFVAVALLPVLKGGVKKWTI